MGSRAKMGTGVNVQRRITALHHIDCPWRPSDITQSNGRAIRQGNLFYENDPENFIIKEFRHITPGTFDERNWELQSKKNEAILNFRRGVVGERSLNGFEEDLLNSNEARAVASENPLIFTEFELNEAIKKERNELKRYKEQVFSNGEEQEKNNIRMANIEIQISKIDIIKDIVKQNTSENFTCKMNKYKASIATGGFEPIVYDFNIPKDKNGTDTNEIEIKQNQMADILQDNINLLFAEKETPREVAEYKGFKVIGEVTNTAFNGNIIFFKLVNKEYDIELEPRSLEYNDDISKGISAREQISLRGFFTRINNVLSDEALQKRLEKNKNDLEKLKESNITLKEWLASNQVYPKQELLNKLQKDLEICNSENEKMIVDRQYKSEFKSSALEEYKNWDKIQKEKLLEKLKERNNNDQVERPAFTQPQYKLSKQTEEKSRSIDTGISL